MVGTCGLYTEQGEEQAFFKVSQHHAETTLALLGFH